MKIDKQNSERLVDIYRNIHTLKVILKENSVNGKYANIGNELSRLMAETMDKSFSKSTGDTLHTHFESINTYIKNLISEREFRKCFHENTDVFSILRDLMDIIFIINSEEHSSAY